MAVAEINHVWTFTAGSTVFSGDKVNGLTVREWSIYADVPAGSTGAFEMLTAASTNSTSVSVVLGSSQAITSSGGQAVLLQFTGPLAALWPRCISLTGTSGVMTIRAIGN